MRNKVSLCLLVFLALFSGCSSKPINEGAVPEQHLANDKASAESTTAGGLSSVSSSSVSALDAAYRADQVNQIKLLSEEMLIQNPNEIQALNALGVAYYRRGQYAAAAALFSKINSISGGRSTAYNNLALIALAKNEIGEALQLFRKARDLDPERFAVAANMGAVYSSVGDHSKVIYVLENFVKKNEADPSSLNHYALALVATGRESEAVEIYEKTLDLEAHHQPTLLNYSVLLIDRQAQYQKGLDLLGRLKFVGTQNETAALIKDLENRAKAGLK